MEEQKIKKLLKEIEGGFKDNKAIIKSALEKELENGNVIRYENLLCVVEKYEDYINEKGIIYELKKYALVCSGNPEITLNVMLDSIIYDNTVTIACSGCKIINEVIYSIIKESIKTLKLKNTWIDYNEEYNEKYIKDNQNKFDEITFVGDYFEFESFKHGITTALNYNNYGYIKLYIDKTKYLDEYKKIMKYSYVENIFIDTYDDLYEFLSESKKEDFGIAYVEDEKIKEIGQNNHFGKLILNKFPFDNYSFKIERK